MRKTTLVSFSAIAALSIGLLAGGGIAVAQETGPFTIACKDATKDYDDAVKADEEWEKAKDQNRAYREAREDVSRALRSAELDKFTSFDDEDGGSLTTGDVDAELRPTSGTAPEGNVKRKLEDLRALVVKRDNKFDKATDDNERALERKAKDTDAGKLRDKANEACGVDPVTTTPPPPPVDYNCGDFPLSDGTTDQQMLDRDRTDPYGLDANNNGIACDVDPVTTTPPPPVDNGSVGGGQVSELPVAIDSGLA